MYILIINFCPSQNCKCGVLEIAYFFSTSEHVSWETYGLSPMNTSSWIEKTMKNLGQFSTVLKASINRGKVINHKHRFSTVLLKGQQQLTQHPYGNAFQTCVARACTCWRFMEVLYWLTRIAWFRCCDSAESRLNRQKVLIRGVHSLDAPCLGMKYDHCQETFLKNNETNSKRVILLQLLRSHDILELDGRTINNNLMWYFHLSNIEILGPGDRFIGVPWFIRRCRFSRRKGDWGPKRTAESKWKTPLPSCHFSGVTHVKCQYQATSIFGKKKSGASWQDGRGLVQTRWNGRRGSSVSKNTAVPLWRCVWNL